MNNIEILRAIQKQKPFIVWVDDKPYNKSAVIENLIQENKELKDTLKQTQDSWYEDTKKIELNNKCEIALNNRILDLEQENKELKEEKVLNEKILYFANNTICNYQEGYQAGLHKEITATEIVAEERERFIVGQEIKRLKDKIHELHNQLDEGNKRVKEDYIPKSKVKEKIDKIQELQINYVDGITFDHIILELEELLEGE